MLNEHRIGRMILYGILVVLAMIVGGTVVLFAQGPDGGEPYDRPVSEDSGQANVEELSLPQPQVAERDAGGEPVAAAGQASAGNPAVVDEVELNPDPSAPNLVQYFKRWSADTFVPYNGSNNWDYHGGGCIYRTGGSAWFNHDVQLPQWAELNFVRFYFYDNDPVNDITIYLYNFDQEGANPLLFSRSSSGSPGQSSVGDVLDPAHLVDNVNGSLTLRVSFGTADTSNLRFCGVRIRYEYELSALNLPSVLNMTNP